MPSAFQRLRHILRSSCTTARTCAMSNQSRTNRASNVIKMDAYHKDVEASLG